MLPRASSTSAGAPLRLVLLAMLALLALPPFLLLGMWSVSGRWLFPSLVPETLTLDAWRDVAGGGALAGALAMSTVLATATGVLGAALALPVGRALARLRGRERHLGAAAAFLPVAAPPLALGTGLQVVALAAGVGGTAAGVLLAHLVPAVGYLSLLFLGTFTLYDARAEEAARTLGATRWQTWRWVTLPLLRRPIAEAVAVGFLISWTQVALTLVVGGGAVRTLPLELFAYVRAGQDRAAAVGALLLIVPAILALASLRWAARRTTVLPA
jgi:putative spermidine/putrescine transport system permease protein